MPKKILLINSDLAKNRGDRAIAEGNIALIRMVFPDAVITGISEQPLRDKEWYGIEFLDMNFQSLSPIQLLHLCQSAYKSDIVLWGGGEILKDYTNKAALWYWAAKMTAIRLCNNSLYGMFQGIGPTKSATSKRIIAYLVNHCKSFIVRDDESREKLIAWGVRDDRVVAASDPAVLPEPSTISAELQKKLADDYGIDAAFLTNYLCIGPREWFHYKQSGIIPFAYKRKLYQLFGRTRTIKSPEYESYVAQLENLTKELSTRYATNILFLPMHMSEGDIALCQRLAGSVAPTQRAVVLSNDTLSPAEVRSVLSKATLMIGFRLHSTIIAVSSAVPSITLYYVDKGRVFFDQIKQSRFAQPIENVLDPLFIENMNQMVHDMTQQRTVVQKEINASTQQLREQVVRVFREVMTNESSR